MRLVCVLVQECPAGGYFYEYVAGAFRIVSVAEFAYSGSPCSQLQARRSVNIFYARNIYQETFAPFQYFGKIQLLVFYKFMVQIHFRTVARFHVLPLAVNGYEIHVQQCGCPVYVECTRRYVVF